MQTRKNLALFTLTVFLLFTFSGCQEETAIKLSPKISIGDHDTEIKVNQIIDEKLDLNNENAIGMWFVPINGAVNYDDFLSNPSFTLLDNQRIKKIIINVIFYIFGYDTDYDDILLTIDKHKSTFWFKQECYYEEGWTIIDEINSLRAVEKDYKLSGIDVNFMMRYNFTEDNYYHISVPFYPVYDDGIVGGYFLYDFYFIKADDKYELVGLVMGR